MLVVAVGGCRTRTRPSTSLVISDCTSYNYERVHFLVHEKNKNKKIIYFELPKAV